MFFLVFVLFLDCFFNMHLCAKLQPYSSNVFWWENINLHILPFFIRPQGTLRQDCHTYHKPAESDVHLTIPLVYGFIVANVITEQNDYRTMLNRQKLPIPYRLFDKISFLCTKSIPLIEKNNSSKLNCYTPILFVIVSF